jgi:hypothetical protein
MKQQTNIVKDRIIYEQKALSYNFDTKKNLDHHYFKFGTAKENVLPNFIFSCSGTIMIKDIHTI